MEWTPEQSAAIEKNGKNILVAAAAGSGKTAVLVERIIQKIINQGLSVDRLLVLTFTEAAAKEMKRKISAAIDSAYRSAILDGNDILAEHLREQSLKIGSANISTVHAFCNEVIRSNIHLTSLPADFKISEDTENAILRKDALNTSLEQYYAHIDTRPGFKKLVFGYGGLKNDEKLRDTILNLHDFVRSLSEPEKWLKNAVSSYKAVAESKSFSGSVWEEWYMEKYKKAKADIQGAFNEQKRILDRLLTEHDHIPDYASAVDKDTENFNSIFNNEISAPSEVILAVNEFSFESCKGIQKDPYQVEAKMISGLKNGIKATFKELCKFKFDSAEAEKFAILYPVAKALKNLVRLTDRYHKNLKRERSLLDFSDLEHECLKLLKNKSEVLNKLNKRYAEIFIDEYQDTNDIQDKIFELIAGDSENRFMVGDIKQSIYGFRNASPRLFAEKYETYAEGDLGERICLNKNFRSREEVIKTVNHIFESIMHKEVGDIDYNDDEALKLGTDYPAGKDAEFATELMVTYTDFDAGIDPKEAESLVVAKRIFEMVEGKEVTVFDKDTGTMRPIEYRDIVILLRSPKGRAPMFERALGELNIPAFTDVGRTYLDSVEVLTVMSFLQIIDNPLQDIPLLAVLRSPIFAFSAEELAKIRSEFKEEYFYNSVVRAAESDPHAKEFIDALEELRNCSEYMEIDELVWKICTEYNYFALAGAMKNGSLRQANLKLLFERAGDFRKSTLSGLFQFMLYIDTLRAEKKDLAPANEYGDGDNVVRILSIHSSKGLEYPVVFLAGTSGRFNTDDINKHIIWHEKTGLGIYYVDTDKNILYPCLSHTIVADDKTHDLIAEEMRLLYVALTRAKEKLVISATLKQGDKKWTNADYKKGRGITDSFVSSCRCYRDWLLPVLLTHKGATKLRELGDISAIPLSDADYPLNISVFNSDAYLDIYRLKKDEAIAPSTIQAAEDMTDRLSYTYPYLKLTEIPVKMSVTEMKRRIYQEGDTTPAFLPAIEDKKLSEIADISGADRGTVTHYILQHIDLKSADSTSDIERQIDDMTERKIITKEQAAAVDTDSVWRFLESPLGRRLKAAPYIKREFDFYMEVPAKMLFEGLNDADAEEKILAQGIADCIFSDEEGTVLLDYKTDKLCGKDPKEYAKRYYGQIELYTKGINAILEDRQITESYLYFLDEGVSVLKEV